MASMEQLQMLNDGESTTSSSSNRSDDEEEDNVGNNSLTASNDDDTSEKFWSNRDDNNGFKEASSKGASNTTINSDFGHHKKRIKLSLGGAFKAMVSSSKQESQEQQKQPKSRNATTSQVKYDIQNKLMATHHGDSDAGVGISTITLKQENPNSTNPMNTSRNILHTQTKSCIGTSPAKEESSQVLPIKSENNDGLAIATPARNGTKLQGTTEQNKSNSKSKMTAASATASASIKNTIKAKEMKRRQSPKLPSLPSTIAGDNCAPPMRKRGSMRSIRITPMSSPGLLLPPGSNVRGGATAINSNDTSLLPFPNSAFTHTMATAGYTTEARSKNPHRGSSVKRSVDDIFDSNVKLCVLFPKLVPEDLVHNPSLHLNASSTAATTVINAALPQSSSSDRLAATTEAKIISTSTTLSSTKDLIMPKPRLAEDHAVVPILMKRLMKAFQMKTKDTKSDSVASSENSLMNRINPSVNDDTSVTTSRERCYGIPQYSDIIPISLSSTYPDAYVQKRLEYAKKINEREKAIVDMQENQEVLQTAPEAKARKQTNVVPPIPIPPDVPIRDDLRAITNVDEIFGSEDQQQRSHPLYLPKNKVFVNHLDKRCFHAIHGRYFGLSSNAIADPYFFGPNAPGIGGLNLSVSTGLATASTGGGAGALGAPLFMLPAQPSSLSTASSKTVTTLSTKSSSCSINMVEKSTKAKSSA